MYQLIDLTLGQLVLISTKEACNNLLQEFLIGWERSGHCYVIQRVPTESSI